MSAGPSTPGRASAAGAGNGSAGTGTAGTGSAGKRAEAGPADTRKLPPDQLLRRAFAQASQVFGQAVSTMMQSPQHRHLLLADLEWRVIPPIALQQYRLVQHKGTPAGFITWAQVSEAVEARLAQPDFRLRPQDWKSGDRLWIIDVVTPPQQAQALIDKVKAELFEGQEVKLRKGAAPEPSDRSEAIGSSVVGEDR